MDTTPEPQSDPIESNGSTSDPFYTSLVIKPGERQTFTVVVEDLELDENKVREIEEGIQAVVAAALAQCAFESKPLEEQAFAGIGGGLAGRYYAPQGGLISELLPAGEE